jgi:50S ribosomal protein L16 3-hydroxylase
MGLRTIFPKNVGFKETHWPARPLLHHGPLSRLERLAAAPALSSPEALIEAAARAGIRLWVERAGQPSREEAVSPSDRNLYAKEAVFTCFGVERIIPPIEELLHELKCELDLPSVTPTCHAYVSATGARVRAHFDRQENLAIHLTGKKRWQIAENETVAFPPENHALGEAPVPALARLAVDWPTTMPAAARTIMMRPGTALFLPRGMWHSTVTLATSLSLTLIFPVDSWAQTLTRRLLERLSMDARFREPVSTSLGALEARTLDFVAAARAVCAEREGRYVVVRDEQPRLRGAHLETDALSIALERRYVPLVRWILSRTDSLSLAEAPPVDVSAVEAVGIVSFLEGHGVLRPAVTSAPGGAGGRAPRRRSSSRATRAGARRPS